MGKRILLIYTGGTIGMAKNSNGALEPVDFSNIEKRIPAILQLGVDIDTFSFPNPIDSSNVDESFWVTLAETIVENYNDYCGFVVLHGTDTMAYTSSILGYMLQGLNKPIVLTGSQLPIGSLRTDGRANLITAIEIASASVREETVVPEICVCFEQSLYRGNRITKHYTDDFDAFKSHNCAELAKVGTHITYNQNEILDKKKQLKAFYHLDNRIKTIRLHPCVDESIFTHISKQNTRALLLQSYGTGNAPTFPWFLTRIEEIIKEGIIVANISQCPGGYVEMGVYQTSLHLQKIGVLNGRDLTEEAAITKLMHLLGNYQDNVKIKHLFETNLVGEMS